MPGQDRLHPGAAPYPAMRPEPLPVRERRAVHLMTSRVFPVRQARVVVGVNSQHAATGQLPGKFRLPRSRIASDKECGHKPSSQPGQAGLSGGQASGTTVFPSHSVIRPRRLGKRYPPYCRRAARSLSRSAGPRARMGDLFIPRWCGHCRPLTGCSLADQAEPVQRVVDSCP
jgi:hypothetical protein